MWYVLQTITGREEELVYLIRKIVPPAVYEDCFVAYYERIWRKQQQSIVHVERLFPGYVFILSETPQELYQELKRVPAMSRIVADGNFYFLPLEKEEEIFFRDMLAKDHIIHLSYIETNGKGRVYRISGPLKSYADRVQKYQFKKRYAIIRLRLLGVEKTVALGILLNEDIQKEIQYGKVEIPLEMPEVYEVTKPEAEQEIAAGDHVTVISGALAGMQGVAWKIKKSTVEIGIRLFDQDMAMEVPIEFISKTSYKEAYEKEKTEENSPF